jgi:hypothetical protein
MLHHLRAFPKIRRVVIGGAHGVALLVRELQLDMGMIETHLMEQCLDAIPRNPWPVIRPL